MRALLVIVALLVVVAVGWFVTSPGPVPAGVDPNVVDDGAPVAGEPGPDAEPPPPVDPRDLSPGDQARLLESLGPGAVLPIPPSDPGPAGLGDLTVMEGDVEDLEALMAMRRSAEEARIGAVGWNSRPLRDVVADLQELSGLLITLEGDDLGDEPVILPAEEGVDRSVFDVVNEIATTRNLGFEIRKDRIVFRR